MAMSSMVVQAVDAEIPFFGVAQTVGFGLRMSKMLCLSMGID